MNRNIPIEELHSFLENEINKAIIQLRVLTGDDKLTLESIARICTELNVLDRIKAKYYKEEK